MGGVWSLDVTSRSSEGSFNPNLALPLEMSARTDGSLNQQRGLIDRLEYCCYVP
jgi:hypothetical protein